MPCACSFLFYSRVNLYLWNNIIYDSQRREEREDRFFKSKIEEELREIYVFVLLRHALFLSLESSPVLFFLGRDQNALQI